MEAGGPARGMAFTVSKCLSDKTNQPHPSSLSQRDRARNTTSLWAKHVERLLHLLRSIRYDVNFSLLYFPDILLLFLLLTVLV